MENGTAGNNLKTGINENFTSRSSRPLQLPGKISKQFCKCIIIEIVVLFFFLIQLSSFGPTLCNFEIATFHQQH